MKKYFYLILFLIDVLLPLQLLPSDLINVSRNSCVEVISLSGNSKGSGFFIAEDVVVTCFHVIANIQVDGKNVKWNIFSDLKVVTINRDTIQAECISVPNNIDPSPLFRDFAILKLSKKPYSLSQCILQFSKHSTSDLKIGSDCYFSGYPLLTPTMVTHKGMISGIELKEGIICIQGAINKGNSGGALLSDDSRIIGIISMREGGISKALEELTNYIESTSKQGSVELMGVDPLQAIKATVETLNTYISTGIGYARDIKYVKDYCSKNKILK